MLSSPLFLFMIVLMLPATVFSAVHLEQNEQEEPIHIRLTLQQAEALFLEQNLLLLAEKAQIDIKEAEIRQARLWDNPEITVEHQIINRSESSRPIGFTGSDNSIFEVEQLISTAGKRRHTIKLLELEKMSVEHAFDQLLREFKRSLREEFFRLAFLNRIEGLYSEQIDGLKTLLTHFEKQQKQGNIARIEVIRIRGLLLEIEEEYNSVLNEQSEAQNALKILLQMQQGAPVPELPETFDAMIEQVHGLNIEELSQLAYTSRSDLLAIQTATNATQQMLRVERLNAFPDLGLGLVYDRLDGPVDNYFGVMLNLQIPLWNRNQGNIQIAKHQIRQSKLIEDQYWQSVKHSIKQSIKRYERAFQLFNSIDKSYVQYFSIIMEALMSQYKNGDLRLVEFIDFYESFRESTIRTFNIQESFLNAAEELNFTIGKDIFQFNF